MPQKIFSLILDGGQGSLNLNTFFSVLHTELQKPSTTLNDCLDSLEVTLQIVKFDENLTNSIPFSRPIFLLDVWASMQT